MPSDRRIRPLIAVIGSVDAQRGFDPPLRDPDAAAGACRELGHELARASCDLAVFSSKPGYAEFHVVQGYAAEDVAGSAGTVVAHIPRHREADLVLPAGSSVNVRTVRDTGTEWEVSFYRALLDCDGAVLVGGGKSTRIAGILAMALRVPLLPVAAFGGGANQVWVNLDKVRNDTDDADIALLGEDWKPDSAARLVQCLLRQRERREARERGESRRARRTARSSGLGTAAAVALLALALSALIIAGNPAPAAARGMALLVFGPMFAAMSGAIIRSSFEDAARWPRAAARGLGAGALCVLLYVATELLAVPGLMNNLDVRRLLFFVLPLGFAAGFTFDLVFDRLRADGNPTPSIVPIQSGTTSSESSR